MNRRQQRAVDYQQTFGTLVGKRSLADLDAAFRHRTSFVPGDPYATAFREGQRAVCELIHAQLEIAATPRLLEALEEEEDSDA